jgi:GNAT superfamily N-acetyltransferase
VIDIEVKPFEPSLADAAVDLAQRAFTVVSADARPKDSPAFLAHMHGEANPAGRAWIAFAREGGRNVATVAAIPARFRTRAGKTVLGYQIGTFVVDPDYQRQGLGSRILVELTNVLTTLPDSFVYAYPNPRSQAALDRSGYLRVAEIPTRIHLPSLRSLASNGAKSLRDGAGRAWDLSLARGDEAMKIVRELPPLALEPEGFLRDQRYFLWRFFGPDCAARYEFTSCRSRADGRGFVLALARHRFKGASFTILVDAFPNVFVEHHALAIRAAQVAGRASGSWFVYLNTSVAPARGVPWSFRLSAARNPRPVQLMIFPKNNSITPDELRASLAMSADWNGF